MCDWYHNHDTIHTSYYLYNIHIYVEPALFNNKSYPETYPYPNFYDMKNAPVA